jgi:DNA polymerase-1
LTTSTGLDSTLISGFLQSLRKVKEKFNPQKTIIAWESKGYGSWRNDLYKSYKANRICPHPDYLDQQEDIKSILNLLNYPQYTTKDSEADDILAHCTKEQPKPIIIYTNDKDMMQLVQDGVYVWTGKHLFDTEKVIDKYLVHPNQIPDLLAISGDSADNIDGIKNHGPVKASKLLKKYKHIENIPDDDLLSKYKDRLALFKSITKLKTNCTLIPVENSDGNDLSHFLNKYELKKISQHINQYKNQQQVSLNSWI